MIVRTNISRSLGWFALAVLGVLLLAALFVIKTSALSTQKQERVLVKILEREVQEIRMLRAEVAHLESPDRISALAQTHLGLTPTRPKNIIRLEDLPKHLPARPDVTASPKGRQ